MDLMNACGSVNSSFGMFFFYLAQYIAVELFYKLASFHTKKIIFRGIDKSIISYDSAGKITVLDMRYSMAVKYSNAKICVGKTYTLCVSTGYMSPSVISGLGHDQNTDFWSLGVLMFELMTGHNPFDPEDNLTEKELCSAISVYHDDITFPDEFNEYYPV